MGEFSDSDSEDLEAMFPDSPDPDYEVQPVEQTLKSKTRGDLTIQPPVSLQGPSISKSLKPLYVSLLKKELFMFSATISGRQD